jgi:hypothetical protein
MAQNNIWDNLKSQRWFPLVSTIVIISAVYKVYKIIRNALNKGELVINKSLDAQAIMNESPHLTHQQALQRVDEIKAIAEDASNAIWGFYWIFGQQFLGYGYNYTEDEDAFVSALNKLNTAIEAQLCSRYYKLYNEQWTSSKGQSLKGDLLKYLSKSHQNKISSVVKNNLS